MASRSAAVDMEGGVDVDVGEGLEAGGMERTMMEG